MINIFNIYLFLKITLNKINKKPTFDIYAPKITDFKSQV